MRRIGYRWIIQNEQYVSDKIILNLFYKTTKILGNDVLVPPPPHLKFQ
jgi:hypothetical protein